MLLNSWATLEASAPTLLSRWACSNCRRSCSASVLGTVATSPIMAWVLAWGAGGRETGSGQRAAEIRARPEVASKVSTAAPERLHRKSLLANRLKLEAG